MCALKKVSPMGSRANFVPVGSKSKIMSKMAEAYTARVALIGCCGSWKAAVRSRRGFGQIDAEEPLGAADVEAAVRDGGIGAATERSDLGLTGDFEFCG